MADNGNGTHPNGKTGTDAVKRGLAQMLKGGVIMDVVTAEHAKIAEDAGIVRMFLDEGPRLGPLLARVERSLDPAGRAPTITG